MRVGGYLLTACERTAAYFCTKDRPEVTYGLAAAFIGTVAGPNTSAVWHWFGMVDIVGEYGVWRRC